MFLHYELPVICLLLILIALSSYTFHKVRRVHLKQYDLQNQFKNLLDASYQQYQAFSTLDRQLQLSYALPSLRGFAASPDFLLLLAEHMSLQQPEVVMECSSGTSTIVLAQCAKQNGIGHVFSLEHDPFYAGKTRQELLKHKLQDWATVVDAPLQKYTFAGEAYNWYELVEAIHSKQIDMLVIDGPPGFLNPHARYPAGPILFPLLQDNAVVFLDDAARPEEEHILEMWLNEFPHLLANKHNCEKGAMSLHLRPPQPLS